MVWLLSRRSLLATLVVVAVIGAVLFAGVSSSGLSAREHYCLETSDAYAKALFSACVGAAAEPAGFSPKPTRSRPTLRLAAWRFL